MRYFNIVLSLFLSLGLPLNSPSQTATAPTIPTGQALVLVQQSLAALNGKLTVTDVTASGTAHSIAGSDDETGSATIKAVSIGASRVDLGFSSGTRSEVINLSTATQPVGSWIGSDGVTHQIVLQNLLTGAFWFFPSFALSTSSSSTGATVTYIGHEIHNGQAVEHVAISQFSPVVPTSAPSIGHLSQLDFFLDSTTFLPAALDFNIHPDNNGLIDIPVEICFTDYTGVNGAQVPFHIQKFINNTLSLDLQLQNASLNTGISVPQITGQ